jgi:hypothetical protein
MRRAQPRSRSNVFARHQALPHPIAIPRGLSIVPPGVDLPELASIDVVLYCAADPSPAAQLFKDLLLEITLPTLARS